MAGFNQMHQFLKYLGDPSTLYGVVYIRGDGIADDAHVGVLCFELMEELAGLREEEPNAFRGNWLDTLRRLGVVEAGAEQLSEAGLRAHYSLRIPEERRCERIEKILADSKPVAAGPKHDFVVGYEGGHVGYNIFDLLVGLREGRWRG